LNKFKLEVEYDYDFVLIGICCHEKDYRICWALNSKLGLELSKAPDFEIKDKKYKDPSRYSLFEYIKEEQYIEFYVIANKSQQVLLIPEHKQADYFLLIKGIVTTGQKETIIKDIREIPMILTAFDIDPNELKSKQNLLF